MRIGVDLGGTKIEGIVLDETGVLVEKIRIPTPTDDYQNIVDVSCRLIETLQSKTVDRLLVGIGTPGALTLPDEVMKNCNSICLNGMPLKRDVEKKLGYKVSMANDADCFALSEATFGAGQADNSVFGVIIGTGTGGGIVIDKKPLSGPNRIAGEWGHNAIPSSMQDLVNADRECYCGRINCIETFLQGRGLALTHFEQNHQTMSAQDIAQQADNGNEACAKTIDIYCQQLARCLATIVNVIDPDIIVLGGGLSNIQQLYDKVPVYMLPYVFNDSLRTKLARPVFGDASGARGAACLPA